MVLTNKLIEVINLYVFVILSLLYLLILISAIYSSLMEAEKQQDYKAFWDIYVRDQMDWLTAHYKKTKVHNDAKKISEIEELFRVLKGKISESKFNKDDHYFKKFASMQKEKYFEKNLNPQSFLARKQIDINLPNPKKAEKEETNQIQENQKKQKNLEKPSDIIVDMSKHQAEEFKEFHQNYSILLLNNLKRILIYLTQQRFSFQNVARHIYRGLDTQKYFVQQGICISSQLINNRLAFYIFMRDLANAIRELQQCGIFHADIAMRNFLLFNCPKEQLGDYKKLRMRVEKIKFKLIDFGYAFFVKGENKKYTLKIISQRLKKKYFFEKDPFLAYAKNIQDIKKIQNEEESYKYFHSQAFLNLANNIVEKKFMEAVGKEQNQPQPIIGNKLSPIYQKYIEKGQYQTIVSKMNSFIKRQMNN